jgi:cytochrome c oxidase cbb3-type subunit 3
MGRLSILVMIVASAGAIFAQPPRRVGGFVPGQQRPPEDPAMVARGKGIYGISCRGCHGADLRGGDMGGPNLLRSMLSLSDREGEKIIPIIQNGVPGTGMPAMALPADDAKAVAAYVRSVLGTIGGQGKPPSEQAPPSILVGKAEEGKAYFAVKCASCHSLTGDMAGIAKKYADPKQLQAAWLAGGLRGRGAAAGKPKTVTISPVGGEKVEGRLIRIDDFVVTVEMPDGTARSFRRDGAVPKVEVNDPLAGHLSLLPVYSDADMHNMTAFLVTLQ